MTYDDDDDDSDEDGDGCNDDGDDDGFTFVSNKRVKHSWVKSWMN